MKTVKLSLSLRTTSDIFASSTRKASATFCSTVISLSLSSHSIREASISFLIGRAQSRDIAQRRETTRTFASIYNPAKCRHCITLPNEFQRRTSLSKLTGIIDSARFPRISQARANQQDPSESARLIESARLQESDRYPPTASHERVIVLHSPPQLEDLSLVGVSSSRGSLDLFGFVGFSFTGQGPFLYLL